MQNTTILHNYMKQYPAFYTYAALRDMIYSNTTPIKTSQVKTLIPKTVKRQKQVSKIQSSVLFNADNTLYNDQSITIKYDPTDVLAINNDQYFSIVFSNFRKQKTPISYIYYNTNTSSLVVMIKNPLGFPVILVNIPNKISAQNIFVNNAYINDDKCYTLPLNDEIFKNTSNKLQSYIIKYTLEENNIRFLYEYCLTGSKPVKHITNKIKDIPIKMVFNQFLSDKVDKLSMLCGSTEFDSLSHLNNMTLNIIAKQNGADVFNTTDTTKNINRIIITKDGFINFTQITTTTIIAHQLSDKASSIRWNTSFNGIQPDEKGDYTFNLYEYSSMFKKNYDKMLFSNNRIVYYAFGQFYEDIYVLCRIVTKKELTTDTLQGYTLATAFDDDFTTKELYVCSATNI